MLTYEKALRSPKIFKAIAGMSPQQFAVPLEASIFGSARPRTASRPLDLHGLRALSVGWWYPKLALPWAAGPGRGAASPDR